MSVRRIYPCLCGFTTKKWGAMKWHRSRCEEWQHRINPQGLAIYRRKQTRQQIRKVRAEGPCVLCGKWIDHTNPLCLCSQAERARQDLLAKHDIDPADFELILQGLAKRYETLT